MLHLQDTVNRGRIEKSKHNHSNQLPSKSELYEIYTLLNYTDCATVILPCLCHEKVGAFAYRIMHIPNIKLCNEQTNTSRKIKYVNRYCQSIAHKKILPTL